MTKPVERRMQRGLAMIDQRLARSERVIWCDQPEHMPAMIDLLIAAGRLSEADRPHCVHWMSVKRPEEQSAEEVGLTVDADEMLEKAGIRTMTAAGHEALRQGRPAFEAFWRDRFGELGAEDIALIDTIERNIRQIRAGLRQVPDGA